MFNRVMKATPAPLTLAHDILTMEWFQKFLASNGPFSPLCLFFLYLLDGSNMFISHYKDFLMCCYIVHYCTNEFKINPLMIFLQFSWEHPDIWIHSQSCNNPRLVPKKSLHIILGRRLDMLREVNTHKQQSDSHPTTSIS